MSVASHSGAVAFSVYQDSKYDIFSIDKPKVSLPSISKTTPPHWRRSTGSRATSHSCWRRPTVGLPEPSKPEVEPV
jgi:hypothetical protein